MNKATPATGNPMTFHMDCVDHLCRLENKLADVRDRAGPTQEKFDALIGLLVEVTDFSEPRFSPKVFAEIGDRIHDLYERSKTLRDGLGGSSWSAAKLFGQGKANVDDQELLVDYADLQKDFNRFLVEYFVICVKRFSTSPDEKRGFLESVDSFISEVDRIWN